MGRRLLVILGILLAVSASASLARTGRRSKSSPPPRRCRLSRKRKTMVLRS